MSTATTTTSETTRDLWPQDLDVNVLSPAMILNEQAEVLAKKTQGIFQPEVLEEETDNVLLLHFDLLVPALKHRTRMLTVRQKARGTYPAIVSSFSFIYTQNIQRAEHCNLDDWKMSNFNANNSYMATNQAEFIELISLVFKTGDARTLMTSILAQLNERKASLQRIKTERPPNNGADSKSAESKTR